MNQSWGHAHPILIFSRQAKVLWLVRTLPMVQIVAQIVPAHNNNDHGNVFLAYSQVKYLVLGQHSSKCFWAKIDSFKESFCSVSLPVSSLNFFLTWALFTTWLNLNQQKQNSEVLHQLISKKKNSHIGIGSNVLLFHWRLESKHKPMPKVLWINPFANVTFLVIIPATLGFEPMTPSIGIKCSNLSAVRHFVNQ